MAKQNRPRARLLIPSSFALLVVSLFQTVAPSAAQTSRASQPAKSVAEETNKTANRPTASQIGSASGTPPKHLYHLQNKWFVATFTDLNTAMVSLEVKGDRYLDDDGNPFQLVTTDKEQYLPFRPVLSGIQLSQAARWSVVESSDDTLRFQQHANGIQVTRTWTLSKNPFQLLSNIEVENHEAHPKTIGLSITSAHYVRREDEKGGFFGRPSPALSHGICQQQEDTLRKTREDLGGDDDGVAARPHTYGPGIEYVALSSVYFALIMAPQTGTAQRCVMLATNRGGTIEDPEGSLFEAKLTYATQTVDPGKKATFQTTVYVGPKDYKALQAFGPRATGVIDLGWFSFIARGMSWLLRSIQSVVGNWGVAIILLTLLVRILLLPFVVPQFRNMAKQRALRPEIDKINELYKDDREKKGAAMMELWRKHKVNPLGGCLPVLLQMPIFFALYQTLSTSIELYHAPFMWWWTDLSSPDPWYVLPAILGALMFAQQKLTPMQMDATQAKIMLYAMPLMMTFFMLLLPAGLCLYMVTSSAIGIAQQRYMYWKMDHEVSAQTPKQSAAEDDDDDRSKPNTALTPLRRAKPRRKKRTRRGRAQK